MKIKVRDGSYESVLQLPPAPHLPPHRPSILFRSLVRVLAEGELKATHFTFREIGMERLGRREPCLIFMNHSCFLDLKIASRLLYPRPFNIVCTSDGFVGKNWLMRQLGCIPTQKFVSDLTLVRDIRFALTKRRCSVLMYPEASYSFDGTATPLPETVSALVKMMGVPLVMIRTSGAFAHDPLYNGLRLRDVPVSAEIEYLLSPDEIRDLSVGEIRDILDKQFTFDGFAWQKEAGVRVTEPFRAEGLNRVLYKCPHCLSEGTMAGHGTTITCASCGKTYELNEIGELDAAGGDGRFSRVPDWYKWEREEVRREIETGTYHLETPVDILAMVNTDCVWRIGSGTLTHDSGGFHLVGCDGKLDYSQPPQAGYSLYADYFWYEIGDMICIGNKKILYYCFPKKENEPVAKARLAAEELYRLVHRRTARA